VDDAGSKFSWVASFLQHYQIDMAIDSGKRLAAGDQAEL
jgi:hypothetical protein